VAYYFWDQARAVLADTASFTAEEVSFAKSIYSNQVKVKDMCLTIITNTSVGTSIDDGTEPIDSDIEWAVKTDNQFQNLALAYSAAGLI
jgi:hypothetical protein